MSVPSFTRGIEGTTRINESVLLRLGFLLITGTETDRYMRPWAPFVYMKERRRKTPEVKIIYSNGSDIESKVEDKKPKSLK